MSSADPSHLPHTLCTVGSIDPLVATTTIDARPDTVWALISDVLRWPDLLPTTVSSVIAVDTARPEEVGARYVMEQPRIPRATWEILEWDPPRRFTWQSSMPGVRTTGTHVVQGHPDGPSTASLAIEWSGPGTGLARMLYGRLTQRYVDIEAGQLKARAEAAG